jgi:predicted lysophospholipase L1 biosynthesis ABC-type transport system permease subunit
MNEEEPKNRNENCDLHTSRDFPSLRSLRIPHILGVDALILEPISIAVTYVALVVLIGRELFMNDDDDHRNGD